VRILLQISRHDRQSKEEVSRLGGEMVVILGPLALALVQSAPSMEVLCRELLVEQFVGNANNIPTTHGALRFMLDAANTRLRLFGAQVRRSVL